MNDMVNDTGYIEVPKPTKYKVVAFTNLIAATKEIYLSKRDFYAEANDDINMRYYEAKADACRELMYTINTLF